MKYEYATEGTCSMMITFDLEDEKVTNISFLGGCDGNLKMISKLVDGWSVEQIEEKLGGHLCGLRGTSCADQLARAVRQAYDGELEPVDDED